MIINILFKVKRCRMCHKQIIGNNIMNRRFEVLDAFRGICAVSVVVFHMHLVDSVTELSFFRGSYIFVEFFFVLSGFVLAHGYAYKNHLNFTDFMKARFFRLYPLHLFMFVVMFFLELGKLAAYKLGGFIFNNTPFTNSFAIKEIIPNLLLVQSWTSYTDPLSFNFPSWSISVEFYMYVLFFCSIVVFKHKPIIWLTSSLISFLLIYLQSPSITPEVLRGVSCFFGGTFTYWLFMKSSSFKLSATIGTCVELMLLTSIVIVVQSVFEYRFFVASVLFMVAVFFFAFEFGFISKMLKLKYFQLMGKLSYSIYMTHAAILFCLTSLGFVIQKITEKDFTPMINGLRFLNFGSTLTNNVMVLAILLVVISLSLITYKYIEVPGQKLNSRSKNIGYTNELLMDERNEK